MMYAVSCKDSAKRVPKSAGREIACLSGFGYRAGVVERSRGALKAVIEANGKRFE